MKLNQKGITLVEVLAGLTLVALVAGIAWTALSIGFKHTAVETNKTSLQQDANLIIATLTNEHRLNEKYSLTFDSNNQLVIRTCQNTDSCTSSTAYNRIIDSEYDYRGTSINGSLYTGGNFTEVVVESEKEHAELTLTLKENNINSNNKITVKTVLTRVITKSE